MLPSDEDARPVYAHIKNPHTGVFAEAIKRMNESEKQYGGTFMTLGPKGQFADIWRKIGPLKRGLWDGIRLPKESVREICMDLIGHLALIVSMIDLREAGPAGMIVPEGHWVCCGRRTTVSLHEPTAVPGNQQCPECWGTEGMEVHP